MNNLIPFDFGSNEIRVEVDADNAPWFVAADICSQLGLNNASQAIGQLYDSINTLAMEESEKGIISNETLSASRISKVAAFHTSGGRQELVMINEVGLNLLLMQSRKKEAFKFKYWIASEVLPSIRKYGYYLAKGNSLEYDNISKKVLGRSKDSELIDKRQVLDAIEVLAKNYYNSLMVGAVITTGDFTHEMDLGQFKTPHFTIDPEAAFWRDHTIYWTIKEAEAISFTALCRSVNLSKFLVDQSLDRLEKMKVVKFDIDRSKYRVV